MDLAAQVMERLEELGRVSDEPDRLTRTFGSPAMRRANELVGSWMAEAGMSVRTDGIGNLIGHKPGRQNESKLLLLGSHLDSVRNAGKYDGPLGVLLAITAVAQSRADFGIEVLGFADEEGVRFQTAYLGSRAMTGDLTESDLARVDADGITLGQAIGHLSSCRRIPGNFIGYAEVHIEQGPVLEEKGHAVGVVTAIAGQTRAKLRFDGQAGHAGTTPMDMRRDALCAAAEFITDVERYARAEAGLTATVGKLEVEPNISNVIPGKCCLTVDVRHQDDCVRTKAVHALKQLGSKRALKTSWEIVQETPTVPCSRELSDLMKKAVLRHQAEVIELPSGAGHDAAVMAKIAPMTMLFVRCRGGVSHHPDESVKVEDVRVALNVLVDFIASL